MVLINEGLNRVRDLVDNDIFKGQAGTDTTAPSESDTGLNSAVAATLLVVSTSVADKTLKVSHVIDSSTATGNTFSEWEVQLNSGGESLNRSVTAGVAHTSSDELTKITTFFFRNSQV